MKVLTVAERPAKDQCASPSLARHLTARLRDHYGEAPLHEVTTGCIEDSLQPPGQGRDFRQLWALLERNLRFASTALSELWSAPGTPDLVMAMPPGVIGGLPAAYVARKRGALSWLHLERLETEIAFRLLDQSRHSKPGAIAHLLRRSWANLENRAFRHFQAISVPSEQMRRRLIARGVPPEHVCVVPYWEDAMPRPANRAAMRQEFGILAHVTAAVYAGPLTRCYALDVVVEAAHVLRQRSDIQVVIGGDGPEFPRLHRLTRNLTNVRLLALTSDLQRELRAAADIHLLAVHQTLGEAFVPPHLPSILASDAPVVMAAPPKAAFYQELSEHAVVVSIHQPPLMGQAVADLAAAPAEAERLNRAAVSWARQHWTKDAVLSRWELEMLIRRAASLPRGPMEPEAAAVPAPMAQTVRKE
ncbi:MAG: glycosyltransferase [Bryobacteraceae bacterium]